MWQSTHSVITNKVTKEQIWHVWSDITLRQQWDTDIEWATLEGPFANDSIIRFKVKGGPKVKMCLVDCMPYSSFTDRTKFPGATMDGIHAVEETAEGLKLTTTFKITGPLSFLWRKLVGEKVAATIPEQTEMLIKVAMTK